MRRGVYFDGNDPPRWLTIATVGTIEKRRYRFGCRLGHTIEKPTTPTGAQVQSVADFARNHAGCR